VAIERVSVPAAVRTQIEAVDAATPPVPARDAATVALLRDGPGGPQVYLLRRHGQMMFAAGQAVFPGGAVDPRDGDSDIGWTGPTAAQWGARFGCPEAVARGLVCAAVRETFEESGVLLAGPDPASVVADTTGDDWETDRVGLEAATHGLGEVLGRRGLLLRSDLLGAWAHWITPAFEPRRYDTRFFVAALPPGQQTRDVSGESDAVTWLRPRDALTAAADGRIDMMPPTVRVCADLADLAYAADALTTAAERRFGTIQPRVVVDDGEVWLEIEEQPA